MERTFWALSLQSLCLLALWPHDLSTAQNGSSEENSTHTPRDTWTWVTPSSTDTPRDTWSQDSQSSTHTAQTTYPNVTDLSSEFNTGRGPYGEDTDGYMSDQDMTSVPFPLLTSTRKPRCQNVEESLTAGEGVIELTETTQDCNDMWTWDIQAPTPGNGIILQFNDVFLRYKCILRIFVLGRGSERVQRRKFTSEKSDSMFFDPLMLIESRVLVVLDAPYNSYKYQKSVVNISYFAHPFMQMPIKLPFNPPVPSVSLFLYECSGKNVIIPKALRCNMVQECALNEDEEGCEYIQQGCGKGWAPYKDQCLRMEFVTSFSYVPGHAHPTFPSVAEKHCGTKYGGTLARLPDAEGVSLVGGMLRQSGHRSAVVGIKKVKPVSKRLRHLYRFLWQWGDKGSPIAYEQQQLQRKGPLEDCAMLNAYPGINFQPLRCVTPDVFPQGYVCMRPNPSQPRVAVSPPRRAHFAPPARLLDQIPTKKCSDGSLVQTFHRCLFNASGALSPNGFAPFQCRYGPHVHYALVCDGHSDCVDGSDEMDCRVKTHAPAMSSVFVCEHFQMIAKSQRCDGMPDCFDESDEADCVKCNSLVMSQIMCTGVGCVPALYAKYIDGCPTIALSTEGKLEVFKPSAVALNGFGMSRMNFPKAEYVGRMFQCISGDYIPSFLVNNGEQDCQFGEDENIPAENVTCPGFYVCQYSGLCVHPAFVCDGIHHCPYKDDERHCKLPCPADCLCEGYAYKCTGLSESLRHARYLDLSGNRNVSLHSLQFMAILQFLNLSRCGIDNVSLSNTSQLRIVDLSFNHLTNLSSMMFERLTGLRTLNLSGNPFVRVLESSFPSFIESSGLARLQHLILRDTNLQSVKGMAFRALTSLITLDIQKNQIEIYDKEIFSGLGDLRVLLTDDSKLCCEYFQTALSECIAPVDELSTCSDLLRSDFFRVFLWTFSVLAITGNAGVLLYRACAKQQSSPPSFQVLVSNLCVADLLMGIYLMIIGIADAQLRGMYVAKEREWKQSPACQIAGFLGLISSEVSAMVICLITLDRLLVLNFPLKTQLHMKGRSSGVACVIMWLLAVGIAAVPFVLNLDFYGETSICLPLPITRHVFSGQWYAFGVFIVLNFVLFVFIGSGQVVIFCIVRNASKSAGARRRAQELAIARRLFLVVFTDFCCWFPVGLMGLLASVGFPIPGEVNVLAAIFILPVNSSLNPFLYTLNTVMERRRNAQLQQKTKKILGNMQSELSRLQPNMAEEVVRVCIRSKVVKREQMLRWLNLNLRQDSNISYVADSDVSTDKTSSFVIRDSKGSMKSSTIDE
ncbi:hypothetical protein ACOMHN_047085 [Nucella lapillus]